MAGGVLIDIDGVPVEHWLTPTKVALDAAGSSWLPNATGQVYDLAGQLLTVRNPSTQAPLTTVTSTDRGLILPVFTPSLAGFFNFGFGPIDYLCPVVVQLMSDLKGPQGPQGDPGGQGEPGTGVYIIDSLASTADLPASGSQSGDAFLIGGDLYVFTEFSQAFVNVGRIEGPAGTIGPAGPALVIRGQVTLAAELPAAGAPGDAWLVGAVLHTYDATLTPPWRAGGDIRGPQGVAGPPGLRGEQGEAGLPYSGPALLVRDAAGATVAAEAVIFRRA